MSKLITQTIEELATGDSVGAKYVVHGTAKAWANLNGTGTIALRDSLNISSVVDLGVGMYTFNMTNAKAAATYSALGWVGSGTDANWLKQGTIFTVSSFNVEYVNGSGTGGFDPLRVFVATHGDLA
jgi:hypothetical protein